MGVRAGPGGGLGRGRGGWLWGMEGEGGARDGDGAARADEGGASEGEAGAWRVRTGAERLRVGPGVSEGETGRLRAKLRRIVGNKLIFVNFFQKYSIARGGGAHIERRNPSMTCNY